MNNAQKRAFIEILTLLAREKHRKKLKSMRNKRYYQKNKEEILHKNKIKNELYKKLIQKS